jgi:Family of unknown function (DUF5683)
LLVPEISLKEQCLLKKIEVDFSSGRVVFFFILVSLILFQLNDTAAQTTTGTTFIPDSILEKQHSPTKATIMSACLPGLGQVYNKKYWKVPIIYAGLGVLTYFIVTNSKEYSTYKSAYIASVNNDTTGPYQDLIKKYPAQDLLSASEYYRRNLEISWLLTGVWYILNIVDAAVDANLFTYNISKDLSLKVDPVIIGPGMSRNFTSGIRLSLRF